MSVNIESVSKFLILALFAGYLSVIGSGMVTMHMDESGESFCPFDLGNVICKMGVFEHLSMLQAVFRGILTSSPYLLLALAFYIFFISAGNPMTGARNPAYLLRYKESETLPASKILRALSDGIIQAKLYA